jgi:DNA-binding transcriptional regulator YdaS (Cro superfamily)
MPRPHRKPRTHDRVMSLIRERGLSAAIAKRLGINRQAISQWTEVPWNRVFIVAEVTGLQPHEIRPDIYPPPPQNSEIPPTVRNRKISAL